MSSAKEVKDLHKRLYRIYYTTYDDGLNQKVLELLEAKYGVKPRYFRSTLVPEFRFVELPLDREGIVDEIKQLVANAVRSQYVRVDWIDTSR
ncbi:MAG: hypothetical protein ACP5HK_00205 [Acidilobus sp.]